MPVIDAYASLGGGDSSVRDYFKRANSIHVLRMIALQPRLEKAQLLEQLSNLEVQSKTPGLGGFPNAVVCPCNIDDTHTMSDLIDAYDTQLLRGVHHEIADAINDRVSQNALASLELLSRHNLCLDISTKPNQVLLC